jgi:perosamine synthetase
MNDIKLFGVNMAASSARAVEAVLQSGYVGEGKKVVEFEAAIARFIGVPAERVVTLNSGTSALTMALRLAGVGAGSHVVSSPMTCLATNEPVLALGATVDWCDVDARGGNITPETAATALYYSTAALMCVHWGGQPCNMDEIGAIARRWRVPVIEDAAHAFGSEYHGCMIGNDTSDFCCFSFQAIKQLTCVDGGALICRREEDAARARLMRWYGLNRGASDRMRCLQDPPEWGWKFHMNDVNATIGLANIEELPATLRKCRGIAQRYDEALSGGGAVEPQPRADGSLSAYWLYTAIAVDADALIAFMRQRGIETGRVHGRNDTKKIFAGSACELPGVDSFDAHHVCLPCRAGLTDSDVERVCSALVEYNKLTKGR